jgi:hypothetical protein
VPEITRDIYQGPGICKAHAKCQKVQNFKLAHYGMVSIMAIKSNNFSMLQEKE